ncbi:MAG: hypothetical protein Q3965_01625 [Rothia sp. (in: high G+C Gram-positive bacteria)]|nr:hypothetical protein [Rothia sp. (in: high G+C Gram-positive bacteria)]
MSKDNRHNQDAAAQLPDDRAGQQSPASAPEPEEQKPSDPALPSFLTHPGTVDKWLLGALAFMTIYSLALIPARAYLIVNLPWLLSLLTGSGLGLLITAAQNTDQPLLWGSLAVAAGLSTIKFMVVYFFMGKHWGQAFIDWIFASHTPLWYRKLEGFVQRHLLLCLFLSFIPFSPIPATILVAIAGIRTMNGWLVFAYCYLLALANKCFYLYLGLTFGEGVQPTLQTIDKYMMQITLVLLAYVFVVNWWKGSKKARQ